MTSIFPVDAERGSARQSTRRTSSRDAIRGSNNFGFVSSFVNNSMITITEGENEEPQTEKLPFKLGDPIHSDATYLGTLRNSSGRFINSKWAQICMTTTIVGNAILLGALTLDVVRLDPELLNALEWLDFAILISFTVEFALQFFYLGPKFIRRTWLVFDLFVVVFSWIFMGTSASVLRAFRIFRVFSLASKWSSMQQLFSAVGKTMPKMGVVAGLLLLLFYSFTVLCTYLFCGLYDEGYLDYDYFGRLDWTFITLFQMLTTDTWFVIVRQVMDASPYSYLLFFFWVSLTSIIILNLIIAIICESLILLKDDLTESEEAGASAAFKQQVPIDYLLKQQRDIDRAQGEMEVAINSLMLRITASKASAVSSRNAMKGSVRASFAL